MTPKQRDALSSIRSRIFNLEHYLPSLARKLDDLTRQFEEEGDSTVESGEFTPEDVAALVRLNERLSALERELCAIGQRERPPLEARVADPNDRLEDYDINAVLYYFLCEGDPAFDEDDDNILTIRRHLDLKHLEHHSFADGVDHREIGVNRYPLSEVEQCWLFHDLYDHDYGLEQPSLSVQDMLRIGSITIEIEIHQQMTLEIASGEWQRGKAEGEIG